MVWRDLLSNLNFNLRITFIRFHAFVLICSLWLCQLQSFEKKITPKCLWWGGSNEYLQSMFLAEIRKKNIRFFFFIGKFSFFGGKIFSIFEWACFRNDITKSSCHPLSWSPLSIIRNIFATMFSNNFEEKKIKQTKKTKKKKKKRSAVIRWNTVVYIR